MPTEEPLYQEPVKPAAVERMMTDALKTEETTDHDPHLKAEFTARILSARGQQAAESKEKKAGRSR